MEVTRPLSHSRMGQFGSTGLPHLSVLPVWEPGTFRQNPGKAIQLDVTVLRRFYTVFTRQKPSVTFGFLLILRETIPKAPRNVASIR